MEIIDNFDNSSFNGMEINFAYDRVLVYNYDGSVKYYEPNSYSINIPFDDVNCVYNNDTINNIENKFNIKFPYILNEYESEDLLLELNIFMSQYVQLYDVNNIIITKLMDEFIDKNEDFIYPIVISDNNIFNSSIILSDKLINQIKNGKARIVFFYFMEGHFGDKYENYLWFSNLSDKYGLDKSNNIIVNGNLLSDETYKGLFNNGKIKNNFSVYPFSWFEYMTLFPPEGSQKMQPNIRKNYFDSSVKYIDNNKKSKKKYHFSCLNRLPKLHRLCIFKEMISDDKIKNQSILSLGSIKTFYGYYNGQNFYDEINIGISKDYKYNKNDMLDFYKSYNQFSNYEYDCGDLENNKAETFNKEVHLNTFVNIITESLVNNNCVFFSEKTYKPIYACQPFILFGNPFSLKKLKEQGYKTFDKWWDESYDLETNFTRRLEKIIDVIKYISTWDIEKCFIVTNQMEDILIHNFNILMNDDESIKLYNFLSNKKPIT